MVLMKKNFYIEKLNCEYESNPLGIDTPNPRFSWVIGSIYKNIKQQYYRIIVAETEIELDEEKKLLWDSGKIESDCQIAIRYAGARLSPLKEYFYSVYVWDCDENNAFFKAKFETGFFSLSDWKSKWITVSDYREEIHPRYGLKGESVIHLRKSFFVDKQVKKARLYIASSTGAFGNLTFAVNTYLAKLNNVRLGKEVIVNSQLSEKGHRAIYKALDVTDLIKQGENVFGIVTLAKAFSLYLMIKFADGSMQMVMTDESWKQNMNGPYTLWDEGVEDQGGKKEDYDSTKEYMGWDSVGFDDSEWKSVLLTDWVKKLCAAKVGAEIIERLKPLSIIAKGNSRYIIDFGQNIHGHIKIKIQDCKRGERISILHSEALTGDNELNPITTINFSRGESVAQIDTYVMRGDKTEEYSPTFANHGFRYVEITNYPGKLTEEDIVACVVHSPVENGNYFKCNDIFLNRLYDISYKAQISNLVNIPTDCPHRERHGWLGDALIVCESECKNFNLLKLFENWLSDIAEDQSKTGKIQYISPFQLHYDEKDLDIPWASASVLIPWFVYTAYGDKTILYENFDTIKRFISYMQTLCEDDGLLHGGVKWNDHLSLGGGVDPVFLGSVYYYACITTAEKIAQILGDIKFIEYGKIAKELKNNINKVYLHDGFYSHNLQSDNAHALCFGLVPEQRISEILDSLVKDIKKDEIFHFGALSMYAGIKTLAEHGLSDLIFDYCHSTKDGSFGNWIVNYGATTAFESLSFKSFPDYSRNHPFLMGSFTDWLYDYVAGVRLIEPGYKKFIYSPYMNTKLTYAEANFSTPYGKLYCKYERKDDIINYSLLIPCNTSAKVVLPSKREKIFGLIEKGCVSNGKENETIIELGSGKYDFNVKL